MFGMEKKKPKRFEFDLEKDLKADRKKADAIIKTVDERTSELKTMLKQGSAKDFEGCGILMHGYTALKKVINKVTRS